MNLKAWNGRCDPQAPLVVIGAGRSGSSLLARIFGAHPDICFDDENDFLAPKMWQLVWEHRRPRSMGARPFDSPEAKSQAENAARSRLAPLVAQSLVTILGIDPERNHWGYKEVWNGSATHRFSWDAYDLLFPRAIWVHLIRHPLDFAGSCAAWNGDELTDSYLEARLADWTAMVEHSRLRRSRERFYELRYEDIVARPRDCVEPILAEMGLCWVPECAAPLDRPIMASHRELAKEQASLKWFRRSKLLAQTAASLGYDL
jgi:hypothetical protein